MSMLSVPFKIRDVYVPETVFVVLGAYTANRSAEEENRESKTVLMFYGYFEGEKKLVAVEAEDNWEFVGFTGTCVLCGGPKSEA